MMQGCKSVLLLLITCRSAKAGFYASKYKKFGNLCYVIGALQAFMGHHNQDMRIRVSKFFSAKSLLHRSK